MEWNSRILLRRLCSYQSFQSGLPLKKIFKKWLCRFDRTFLLCLKIAVLMISQWLGPPRFTVDSTLDNPFSRMKHCRSHMLTYEGQSSIYSKVLWSLHLKVISSQKSEHPRSPIKGHMPKVCEKMKTICLTALNPENYRFGRTSGVYIPYAWGSGYCTSTYYTLYELIKFLSILKLAPRWPIGHVSDLKLIKANTEFYSI
jgi:hypothetical protein